MNHYVVQKKGTQVAVSKPLCSVSGVGSTVLAKSWVKKVRYVIRFLNQTYVFEFLRKSEVWVMSYGC